jgi:hypothetical protein
MVLDPVKPFADPSLGQRKARRDLGREARNPGTVPSPISDETEPRPASKSVERLPPEVSLWIPRHGEAIDVFRLQAAHLETRTNGLQGKPRPVFDASKTLFFNGGDEHTVAHQSRRDVAVIGVDAQDVHLEVRG